MQDPFDNNFKLGILGGGQLGKMLCEAASPLHITTHVLDVDSNFPAAHICHKFTSGNFKNYEDVIAFGRNMDVLTIEIESVNVSALKTLEKQGIKVYPQTHVLDIITDKGAQKNFYEEHNLPTSSFVLTETIGDITAGINEGTIQYPFVQKVRREGYDGRGVQIIRNEQDLPLLLQAPSVVEELVNIDKELGIIVARNPSGELAIYDPVEMIFDPEANLVDYLQAPANISLEQINYLKTMAKDLICQMDMVGILAIEWFLDKHGNLLINEMAPRTHNSGHHTIEACACSQFEQHIRSVVNLPLGNTSLRSPAIMINLLGADNENGIPVYDGMERVLEIPDAHPHIYGKILTKPFRKMGHLTILGKSLEQLLEYKKQVKTHFAIKSKAKE